MSLTFRQYLVFGSAFEVTERYDSLEPIGIGASGLVCSAKDRLTGLSVAIKKVSKPFSSISLANRTYRELKLLKHLKHDNTISLIDSFVSPSENLYITTELLGTDLQSLLTSRPLERKYSQYFFYQIVRGLKYVHSAGVVHRDLKPANILINENCELKICDFGLAKIVEKNMTEYVSTRYYRAPEIILCQQNYEEHVDIWSAACLLAEMLQGKPLFPSKNYVEHFCLITDLIGNPEGDFVKQVFSERMINLINSLPKKMRKDFREHFSDFTPAEIEVLEKTLTFDIAKRAKAPEILEMKYLEEFHDEKDEPVASAKFDWSFMSADYSIETLKNMTFREVREFRRT